MIRKCLNLFRGAQKAGGGGVVKAIQKGQFD